MPDPGDRPNFVSKGEMLAEIKRLRAVMKITSDRLHGLATMTHSNGAVEECAVYLDDAIK